MSNFDKNKVFNRMMLLCAILLTAFLILKISTGIGFEIIPQSQFFVNFVKIIDGNKILYFLYTLGFSFINIFLYQLIIFIPNATEFKNYIYTVFKVVVLSCVIKEFSTEAGIIVDLFIMTGFPIYLDKNKWRDTLIAFPVYIIIASVSMYLRDLPFNKFIDENSCVASIYTLDIHLSMVIIYLVSKQKGGVYLWVGSVYYGLVKHLKNLQSLKTWQEMLVILQKQMQLSPLLSTLKLKTKIRYFLMTFGVDTGIVLTIAVYALLVEALPEAISLFICYAGLRYVFPTTYHTTPVKCALLSIIMFCTALRCVLPLQTSLLSAIIVGFVVDGGLWLYQDRLNLVARYNTDFTKYGLTKYKAQIAYEYKIKGLSLSEQADKYKLSEKVISNYRNEINNAIKSTKV